MPRRNLTEKQQAFLDYVQQYISSEGVWPTYKEITDQFDYRSPNSVTQNLQALHRKGLLLKDDDGYHFKEEEQTESTQGIPIKGIITAGRLQEAIEENLGTITLSTLFPQLDRIYAIRVSGNSMAGEDIQDGDYVLLMDDDIPNGGIGAILYDGETTLKRVFYDEYGLRLVPANDEFSNIYIRPDVFEEVRVLGRYVGHVTPKGIFRGTSKGISA